jgi:hypothetical protein
MRRLSPVDRIDEVLGVGTLAEAEALFERAALIIKIRRQLEAAGVAPVQHRRTRKKADQPALPLEAAK